MFREHATPPGSTRIPFNMIHPPEACLQAARRVPQCWAMYPRLAEYALIGDCHSAALVSRRRSIDWCCLPRFDSDSCFGRLLDCRKGGYFEVAARGRARITREYLGRSLILATTFETSTGRASLLDFFS